jgi:hypothetical protein
MARVKQAGRANGTTKTAAAAATALGAVGLGFSLTGGASASTLPAADVPQSDTNSSEHRLVLNDEEMADVSLATFHLFDRELGGTGGLQQVAWGCRCGGCRGCGGCCQRWGRCRWC